MNGLELRIKNYADARWPDRDIKSLMRKLAEEHIELMEAVAQGDEAGIRFEAADMAILLVDLLALQGDSLTAWMEIKTKILERRLREAMSSCYENANEEIGG